MKDKLGQLLMVGFWGTQQEDPWIQILSRQIEEGKVGGIIFYSYNIESPSQVLKLTHHFKSLKAPYPLLVGIDEEGGRVQRLTYSKGFPEMCGAEVVATTLDPKEAFGYYVGLAQKVSGYGFNLNFGPVIDVNPKEGKGWIGKSERSYGKSPQKVIVYAHEFLKAHATRGVLTCLKHFPGHGRATGDTHKGFVDVTKTWTEDELLPFEALMQEAPFIMTAHVTHTKWEEELPLTFSQELLSEILRKKMGYEGIIITDDLHMGAVQQVLGPKDASLKALRAGNDMIMFSNNPNAAQDVQEFRPSPFFVEDILEFLRKSDLNMNEIAASFSRVLKLKARLAS